MIPSGTMPLSLVPVGAALPAWNVSGTSGNYPVVVADVLYDGYGSSSNWLVSINDSNTGHGYAPIQGQYTVAFKTTVGSTATIGQTGLIPPGTESLRMDVRTSGSPFSVLLVSGLTYHPISMMPLENFPDYTAYGGDVSALAGKVVTLSITESSPLGAGAGLLELDNINFSVQPVPEPGISALFLWGAAAFGYKCRRTRVS